MSGAAAAVAAPDAGAELVSCCVAETSPARRRILTGRPLGQGVHQPDRAWVLVGREPIADDFFSSSGSVLWPGLRATAAPTSSPNSGCLIPTTADAEEFDSAFAAIDEREALIALLQLSALRAGSRREPAVGSARPRRGCRGPCGAAGRTRCGRRRC